MLLLLRDLSSKRDENIVGKGKYSGYLHYLLFSQNVQKPSLLLNLFQGADSVIECTMNQPFFHLADVRHSYNENNYNLDVYNVREFLLFKYEA